MTNHKRKILGEILVESRQTSFRKHDRSQSNIIMTAQTMFSKKIIYK